MKAAFFGFTIAFGGAPQGTISIANRLAKNMEIHIIDAYGSCDEYSKKVREIGLPLHILHPNSQRLFIGNSGKPLRRLWSMLSQIADFHIIRKSLVAALEEINPNLVWVNNEKSLAFLLGPRLRARFPVILYYRGWATRDQIGVFFRFLIKHRVDGVIVHSREIVDQLLSIGIPEGKILATPNAVGLVKPAHEARCSLVDLPGLNSKLKILLPAARPVPDKGHDVAIRALRRLRDSGLDAILWITGKVPTGVSSDYLRGLKSEVARLGLEQFVHFIGWRDDIQIVIAHSDVVVVPSRTEGFPRVIVEAMLLDVPVCATPVGGIPEAIIDGKTGFLIDIGNDELLANRIIALGSDDDMRTGIVRSAKLMAGEMFSLEKQTTAVEIFFKRAVEHGNR